MDLLHIAVERELWSGLRPRKWYTAEFAIEWLNEGFNENKYDFHCLRRVYAFADPSIDWSACVIYTISIEYMG